MGQLKTQSCVRIPRYMLILIQRWHYYGDGSRIYFKPLILHSSLLCSCRCYLNVRQRLRPSMTPGYCDSGWRAACQTYDWGRAAESAWRRLASKRTPTARPLRRRCPASTRHPLCRSLEQPPARRRRPLAVWWRHQNAAVRSLPTIWLSISDRQPLCHYDCLCRSRVTPWANDCFHWSSHMLVCELHWETGHISN